MAENEEILRELFFGYYAKYIEANELGHSQSAWINAVYCIQKLQEIAPHLNSEPEPEDIVMQNLFSGVLTEEQVTKSYFALYSDSKKLPSRPAFQNNPTIEVDPRQRDLNEGSTFTTTVRAKCRMKFDPLKNHRILVIDDNPAVHEGLRKILSPPDLPHDLEEDESALFGANRLKFETPIFEINSAFQGQDGLEMVKKSLNEDQPYALAFVDVRMPPGWDGIETISRIWSGYPDLQVVICSAYSDYSLQEMSRVLGFSDRLIILNKPFDNIEIMQLAIALTKKWQVYQQVKIRMAELDKDVQSALTQPW
jgi:CheY-like chemotaxis protein